MKEILSTIPFFPEEVLKKTLKEIELTLKSGRLTDGPVLAEFERKFAEYHNTKYAIGVSSGTASLDIALRHYNIKGREVIVPTNTFISTPNAVIFAGGSPVFADMKSDTLCIDPEDVKRKVTPNTVGVIAVHIAGLICPQIDELRQFCKEKGLFLFEDAAHAHGAMIDDRKAGTLGDVGCFSFYPTKVMTSCEGGMILTNNHELAEKARCIRTCGQNQQRQMIMLGHNWRLNEVAAVIGKNQLEHLEEFLAKRDKIAKAYEDLLSDVEGVSVFQKPPTIRHSYYKYPVLLNEKIDRIKLGLLLKEKYGIEVGHVYYPPCHLHPYYQENFGTGFGDFPVAERVLPHVMCLPLHCGLSQEDVEYVKDSLVSALKEFT